MTKTICPKCGGPATEQIINEPSPDKTLVTTPYLNIKSGTIISCQNCMLAASYPVTCPECSTMAKGWDIGDSQEIVKCENCESYLFQERVLH